MNTGISDYQTKRTALFLFVLALTLSIGALLFDLALPGLLPIELKATAIVVGSSLSLLAGVVLLNGHMQNLVVPGMADAGEETRWDLQDDIWNLVHGNLTRTHAYVVTTVLCAGFVIFKVLEYRKLQTSFWDVIGIHLNMWVVAIPFIVFTAWFTITRRWFKYDHSTRTPKKWFFFVVFCLLASVAAGLYYTEPQENGGLSPYQVEMSHQEYRYDYSQTRASSVHIFTSSTSTSSGSSGGISIPSCSGKSCWIIAVVVGGILAILGSALIPHFWAGAGLWLLSILVLMTWHEIRVRESVPKEDM